MTRTESYRLDAPSLSGYGEVVVHGHWGRPVLWFPSEGGSPGDFEANGILEASRGAVDEGLIKVFCVPSFDRESWSASWMPVSDRARQHRRFEDWIIWQVVPSIREHCGGRDDIATAGPSMGAFHAVLFALRHPHVFPRALGLSGNYDPWSWHGWGAADDDAYFTSPLQFLPNAHGGHLEFLRSRVFVTLVVGSGMWEDTTGAHESTRRLGAVLAEGELPHEVFVWGPEWPHDWPSWRAQAAVYLPALG